MTDEMATALVERRDDRAMSAFSSGENFETAQRMARALISSSLVPKAYSEGKNAIPNTLIAMELANRIGASPLMVMQNLDIIYERPAWRSTFLIATVNASGRFSPLRFRFQGEEGSDDWGCRAHARDLESGDECEGSLITIDLAKAEGWHGKKGSKWKTMPEQMLRYRAAAFWARIYAPELSLGMYTTDEVADFEGAGAGRSASTNALNEALESEGVEVVDEATGEIIADADDDSPPTKSQIDQLRGLMDKTPGDYSYEQIEGAELAIHDKDGPGVRQAIREIQRALASGQGDLLEGS